jgi:starch-binding outer membrane protein, SusD/RagB family
MELNKYNINIMELVSGDLNKGLKNIFKALILVVVLCSMTACESFLEIDAPKNKLVSETVFEDASTVKSALANIYYKMREQGMISGNFGLSVNMGAYADELDYYGRNTNQLNLFSHTITANDPTVLSWWNQAYNLIYAANDIIQGMEQATALTDGDRNRFKGQALFVRGFLHSLLVGLYGDIPYIKTTNYLENNTVSRMTENAVYEEIIKDLGLAVDLLDDVTGERVLPNKSAARALLARMYLYHGDWELAEVTAGLVIGSHVLETDITKVFLKNAKETLWQLKPGGVSIKNTQEAQRLIITAIPTQGYALTTNLLSAFETGDLRRTNWVGSFTSNDKLTTLYFAHKYKQTINTTTQSLEYSIVMRLAEQYLIRAEARAHIGNISGAQADINKLRNRAGLANTTASSTEDLLTAVLHERQVELFTEHGHRWFDLNRFNKATEVVSLIKPNWKAANTLLPLPGKELEVNPNLEPQNSGY